MGRPSWFGILGTGLNGLLLFDMLKEKIMDSQELWDTVQREGVPYDSHASDLYIPVNNRTRQLIQGYQFQANVTTFINNHDRLRWYDIPFAYVPYWDKKKVPQ